jgi:hypothetical protein
VAEFLRLPAISEVLLADRAMVQLKLLILVLFYDLDGLIY